uniref:TOG domain-containing protein n=1 Tax=Branchiostoma floridae TaxID=7739 RepID=C3YFJ3_BRAFL|eukprot:XP_002604946.1 hypothetical protein BRAFLDRAFT_77203 [Branchiostoma floridae]
MVEILVLWPYILELLGPPQYTPAFGSIARCAAHLANKKREANDEDYMLDYEISVNIPKPPAMISRLVVMAGQPHAGGGRGQHILLLMKGLSPNLNPDLVDLWDAVIPKLIQFLEDCDEDEEKWSQKTWEDLMLKMLSKSMEVVNDDDWMVEFGTEMGKQIPLYNNHPEEKNFLYKCLGVIMRSCSNKQFVQQHLDLLFSTVKHTSQVEREGCAIGVGYCASSHLDTVIAKLEDVAKKDMVRKSTGFMGLLKDKSEVDVERVKSTVMLCHGYLTFYAPITLVTSRIESSILRSMNPHFSNVKDPSVKQNLIRAVELIGKALHPSHLNALFEFSRRGELITHMQLDPKMNEADTFDLIKVTTDSVYGLPAHGGVGGKGKEDSGGEGDKGPQVMMQEALDSLNSLLKEILKKSVTPDGLQEIFKHLEPWMVSAQDHERERVMHTALEIFNCYLEHLEFGPLSPTVFSNHGTLLGRLTPRCTDPSLTVRQMAIDCVQVVLKIGLRYEGQPVDYKDQMVEALTTLKERVVKDDPQVLFSVVSDLAKVLVKKVLTDQLLPFLDLVLQGLIDVHPHASSGACVVLNSMVKTRGSSLHQQVRDVIDALHVKLGEITVEQTKKGTLRTVRTMATHHLVGVANALLNKPLPFDENLVECWKILAAEPQLTANLIDHLLEIMARHVPYEEKAVKDRKQRPPRTATALPMAASCALAEILQVPETEEVVISNYHRLFSAVMVRVGATTGVKPPPKESQAGSEQKPAPKPKKKDAGAVAQKKELDPCGQAIETLQGFLTRSKSEGILELMDEEEGWELLKDVDKFQDGIMLLARGLATTNVQHVAQVVACLNSFLSSLLEPQRVVVVAFFAELINQKCVNDLMLVELLVNSMLGRLVDESHIVRMLCIRGLGNIASVGDGQEAVLNRAAGFPAREAVLNRAAGNPAREAVLNRAAGFPARDQAVLNRAAGNPAREAVLNRAAGFPARVAVLNRAAGNPAREAVLNSAAGFPARLAVLNRAAGNPAREAVLNSAAGFPARLAVLNRAAGFPAREAVLNRAAGFPAREAVLNSAAGFPARLAVLNRAAGIPAREAVLNSAAGFPARLAVLNSAAGFPARLAVLNRAAGFPARLAVLNSAAGFPARLAVLKTVPLDFQRGWQCCSGPLEFQPKKQSCSGPLDFQPE